VGARLATTKINADLMDALRIAINKTANSKARIPETSLAIIKEIKEIKESREISAIDGVEPRRSAMIRDVMIRDVMIQDAIIGPLICVAPNKRDPVRTVPVVPIRLKMGANGKLMKIKRSVLP